MLLQQLLQRNQQNVRLAYLQEQRKKRILNVNFCKRKKHQQLKSNEYALQLDKYLINAGQCLFEPKQFSFNQLSSNLLQHKMTKPQLIEENRSIKSTKNSANLKIIGDKFIVQDQKAQYVKQVNNLNKDNRIHSNRSKFRSRSDSFGQNASSLQGSFKQTNFSFYDPTRKSPSSLSQRKIMTASTKSVQPPETNKFGKGVFELPDCFTIKSSLNSLNRPHSTHIKIDQKNLSGRQESIHSRRKMRHQEEIMRKRKAMSQQEFYKQDGKHNHSKSKVSFSKNKFQSLSLEQEENFKIDIEKIQLQQKQAKRNEYVNVFYEYRKSKGKIQEEELYEPWKKHQKDKKSIDLSELIHLHHY